MKKILLVFATLFGVLVFQNSFALSEYGSKCDENEDCVECRDVDAECAICMNNCFNRYGPAEVNSANAIRTKFESCRLKRARWCNAQCWDPDDKKVPDYVSTKPDCRDGRYPKFYEGGFKKSW